MQNKQKHMENENSSSIAHGSGLTLHTERFCILRSVEFLFNRVSVFSQMFPVRNEKRKQHAVQAHCLTHDSLDIFTIFIYSILKT